jgi:hypothetical protein
MSNENTGEPTGELIEPLTTHLGDMPLELEIVAQGKNEIILGETSEVVGGNELVAVVGGTEYIHLLEMLDIVLGLKQDIFVGKAVELGTEATKAKLAERKLEASYSAIFGEGTKIVEAEGQVMVKATVIDGTRDAVNGIGKAIVGQEVDVVAEGTSAVAAQIATVAQKTSAVAEQTIALANAVTTLANATAMAGAKTEMGNVATRMESTATAIHSLSTIL